MSCSASQRPSPPWLRRSGSDASSPPWLLEGVTHEKLLADRGTARIEQHAFADFLDRGELDRHLRRMRMRYRKRRDALVEALTETLPEAAVSGVAAGCTSQSSDLKRPPGEPSYRLVPDTLIEQDGQATTAGGTRHGSAFAVGRTQLAHQCREVLATGGRRSEPCMHPMPRFGRRDLQQLRRQAVDALGNPLGLLRTQTPDRRHRPLNGLKLTLKLFYGVLGRHSSNGSSRGRHHRVWHRIGRKRPAGRANGGAGTT